MLGLNKGDGKIIPSPLSIVIDLGVGVLLDSLGKIRLIVTGRMKSREII